MVKEFSGNSYNYYHAAIYFASVNENLAETDEQNAEAFVTLHLIRSGHFSRFSNTSAKTEQDPRIQEEGERERVVRGSPITAVITV